MALLRNFFKENIFNLLIVLILCGRFYFIIGFTGMLKPVVDNYLIGFRDFILLMLSLITFILFKKEYFTFFKVYRKKLLIFISIVIVTLLVHSISKSFYILSWHYIRNIFGYSLLIPITYVLIKRKKINFEVIINSFLILNLFFSVIELLFFPNSMLDGTRPLGIVGDPIVASAFNYLLVFKILFKKINPLNFILIFATFICLDYQASITALTCAVIAVLLTIICKYSYLKKYMLRFIFFLALFMSVTFYSVKQNDLSDRITTVFYGAIAPYFGIIDQGRRDNFKDLSEKRMGLYAAENVDLETEEMVSDTNDSRAFNFAPFIFLFGEFFNKQYYKLDSNILSLFKNVGALSVVLYYSLLWFLFFSVSTKICFRVDLFFFCLLVFSLSFFCATVYKFPMSQLLFISLGWVLWCKDERQTI